MAGFDVPGPEVRDPEDRLSGDVNKATVLRLELSIPPAGRRQITGQTVIARRLRRARRQGRLPDRPDRPGARPRTARSTSRTRSATRSSPSPTRRRARQRRHRPGRDQGRAAEAAAGAGADPRRASPGLQRARTARSSRSTRATGKQLYAQWIDTNQAQSPPGNGDLFGIAHDAGRQGLLLRRGRREHADGGGAMSKPRPRRVRPDARGFWRGQRLGWRQRDPARRRPRCRSRGRRHAKADARHRRRPAAQIEPFWGEHQGGIVTPAQGHTYFAAFDLHDDQARRRRACKCCDTRWTGGGRSTVR